MIKLVKVEWAGFGALFEPGELRLDRRGLVLVLGDNHDTTAASSNGAGKTTLFKALSWGLYGRTVDGLTTNVIHKAARLATVDVKFETGRDTYLVKRTRTRRSGALSLHKLDGGVWRDVSQTKAADTQAAIEHLLGLDWNAFRCCCLFGQGDVARFASPTIGDAQRKAILTQVLGLDVYERARAGAKELAGFLVLERKRLADELAGLKDERADVLGKLAAGNATRVGLEELASNGIASLDGLNSRLAGKLAHVDTLADNIRELEAELDDATAAVTETKAEIDRARQVFEKRRAAHETARARADALKDPGPCPTCGAERDAPDPDEYTQARKVEKRALEKRERADELLVELYDERDAENASVVEARTELDQTRKLKRRTLGEVDDIKAEIETMTEELDDLDDRLDECNERVDELVNELADIDSKLTDIDTEHDAIETQLDDVGWWKNALGPKGIPAFAIEAVLPVLNAKTNQHLLVLADGDIVVEWMPTTEKVGGGAKEELTLKLVVEGIEEAKPSGGQQRKVELATELALAEIVQEREGSGTNALFLDEAFEGIDPDGAERVCEWLDGLGFDSVFVVSHTDEVEERFDSLAIVTKRGGRAKLSEET